MQTEVQYIRNISNVIFYRRPVPDPLGGLGWDQNIEIQLFQNMVMLHIKGNYKCSNVVANILPAKPLLPPPPGGQIFIFTEHVHIKLNRFTNAESWQQIFCKQTFSLPHPTLGVGSKFNFFRTWLCCISNAITIAATCKIFWPQNPRPHPGVKIQLFQNMVMLHIKLKGITDAAT